MSHFNLLEAKITDPNGKEILAITGQLNSHLVKPYFHLLITDVKYKEGINPLYERFDTCSLSEFVENLYKFQNSLCKSGDYPEVKINWKGVDKISD